MPININSDLVYRKAKPQETPYMIADGGGLRLLVKPNGNKLWRFNYRFAGKQNTLALGSYPERTLVEARAEAERLRKQIKFDKIDPAAERKANNESLKATVEAAYIADIEAQQAAAAAAERIFSKVARLWWLDAKVRWSEEHAQRIWTRLEQNILPTLGHVDVQEIKPGDIMKAVRAIEARGAKDVARRINCDIDRINDYAMLHGFLDPNRPSPSASLKKLVTAPPEQPRPSIGIDALPMFLRDLETYESKGRLLTKLALKLLIYTFVRSSEVRGARWSEFDLEAGQWRIPAERMKMRTPHIVPLTPQILALLEELRPITGQFDLLFPSERKRHEPMSDNTMRLAMMRMGYDGNTPGKPRGVPHGFRSLATSILNEAGFNPDAIERQMSHQERNSVRKAYNYHAQYMQERYKIMQWWCSYVDDQRTGAKIVPIHKRLA